MDVRADLVELALSYDEVGVTNDRDKYIEIVGPEETEAMQKYMCQPKTSGCGLVVRGLWRESGVSDRRVKPPYVFGKVMEWLRTIATERMAWVQATAAASPSPGDMVLVGGQPADGGVEHVFTVTALEPDEDGLILHSIDGGQRDSGGNQCILAKRRRWVVRKGVLWDVPFASNDPGGNAPGGRRVQGWADFEKLMAYEQTLS